MSRIKIDPDLLKPWLLKTLEPICEADPTVLSDYILALLDHDSDQEQLRQLCLSQLDDFLDNQTASFVAQLFDFLTSPAPPNRPLEDSRKRKLAPSPPASTSPNLPPAKHARSTPYNPAAPGLLPTAPASMRRDQPPAYPREQPLVPGPAQWGERVGVRAGPPGPGAAGASPTAPWGPLGRAREGVGRPAELCKDYHLRGFCPLGDSCPYLHDIPPPPPSLPHGHPPGSQSWRPLQAPALPFSQPFPFPSSTPFPSFPLPGSIPPNIPPAPFIQPPSSSSALPPPVINNGRPSRSVGRQAGQRRLGPGSVDSRPQSTTTLVIENIPRDALTITSVRQFFDKFGTVVEVVVDQPALRAIVTFADPEQARKALGSPEAVFGNRFVRVFRQRLDVGVPSPPFVPTGALPRVAQSQTPLHGVTASRPSIRTQEIEERALRASRLLENAAEQKELMRSLESTPPPDAAARTVIMATLRKLAAESTSLSQPTNLIVVPGVAPNEPVTGHQAHLDRLRREAAALGLNTQPPHERPVPREAFRQSRGSYPTRGARGNFTRTFRLDNRTTKLVVGNISDPGTLPALQEYFQQFGQLVSIQPTANSEGEQLVEFKMRSSAEQALSRGSVIPGVGQVSVAWASLTHSHAAEATPPSQTADVEMDAGLESPAKRGAESPDAPIGSGGKGSAGEEDEFERSWNR